MAHLVIGSTKPPTPPERTHSTNRTPTSRRELPPIPQHSLDGGGDWESRDQQRQRELEEARQRLIQMEKTMRWWSDCTSSWREKWSKMRDERNKAREDFRNGRSKLEVSMKEITGLKRDKDELIKELVMLRNQFELVQQQQASHVLQGVDKERVSLCSYGSDLENGHNSSDNATELTDKKFPATVTQCSSAVASEDFVTKLLAKKSKGLSEERKELDKICSENASSSWKRSHKSGQLEKSVLKTTQEMLALNVTEEQPLKQCEESAQQQQQDLVELLQKQLTETQQMLQAELVEKSELTKELETLQVKVTSLSATCKDVENPMMMADNSGQTSTEDAVGTLGQGAVLQPAEHVARIKELTLESDRQDHCSRSSSVDRQLGELRKELERLQTDNAEEWGRRERLESEKLILERENKRLKNEIEMLEDEATKRTSQSSPVTSDLSDTAKLTPLQELSELKHAHNKLKKALQEKSLELEHARSRAEQYEMEVRKLRTRVEELKQGLASAEDEVDQHLTQFRKCQRTNEDLQEQLGILRLQVDQLQERLRSQPSQALVSSQSSAISYEPSSATDGGRTEEEIN